ncbi:hypothetical protein [Chlamydiifrater volucris]|uniref:hypothetical protein n=1 Tax=Chlamydiifrater volucris TaxID=2681470 RepID=UPI001BCC17D8|nr:hypothetical protein [Chlamydiifrater volucris]
MSLPIDRRSPGTSPQPSTLQEPPQEERTIAPSLKEKILSTFDLLQNLLLFHIQLKDNQKSEPHTSLSEYNIQTVKSTSQQIQEVMEETTKGCMDIAKALIASNISLEQGLSSNRLLTSTELSLIKSTLKDFEDAGGTSSTKRPSPSQEKELEQHLPLKKRKYFLEAISTPSLIPQPKRSSLESECSLETVKILLGLIKQGQRKEFLCSMHTLSETCSLCLPIKHFLSTIHAEGSRAPILEQQISVLLDCTTMENLANCLYKNRDILKNLLNAKHIRNHQLATIALECDIGDEICLNNLENPKTQAIIYSHVSKFTSEGLSSPFVSKMKEIWESSNLPQEIAKCFEIINPETNEVQKMTDQEFASLIPCIQRSHRFRDQRRTHGINYSNRMMSPKFAKFLSSLVFRTAQIILLDTLSYGSLLTEGPNGVLFLTKDLLMQICSLILCSNTSWILRILPCKASVNRRETLEFEPKTTALLHEAIVSFTRRSGIILLGRCFLK